MPSGSFSAADALRRAEEIRRLERLADLLDTRFVLPGTGIRFGLDSLIGLVPGLGDTAAALPSLYLIWRARKLGLPTPVLGRMGANLALDFAVGLVPILGDIFDVAFKANRRNVGLLREALAAETAAARTAGGPDAAAAIRAPRR